MLRNRHDHYPDGVITAQVRSTDKLSDVVRIGVQVELTVKMPTQRMINLLQWFNAQPDYHTIWYFVNKKTASFVTEQVRGYKRFIVYDLESFTRLHPPLL